MPAKPDKIARSDFGQPQAGPKGGIQGCIPQSSFYRIAFGADENLCEGGSAWLSDDVETVG
ncbi:MAG: hypothetical protein OEY27_08570 [Gammaproteobacteria bacterium]|nr:hypothetical protein [Gammaproteobacteria bacterium]